ETGWAGSRRGPPRSQGGGPITHGRFRATPCSGSGKVYIDAGRACCAVQFDAARSTAGWDVVRNECADTDARVYLRRRVGVQQGGRLCRVGVRLAIDDEFLIDGHIGFWLIANVGD